MLGSEGRQYTKISEIIPNPSKPPANNYFDILNSQLFYSILNKLIYFYYLFYLFIFILSFLFLFYFFVYIYIL
jgi:hypothetical protein